MKNRFYNVSAVLLVTCLSTTSYAQRGALQPGSPSGFKTPYQGYPGFFDTNLADHGSLVVEWPPLILPLIPMPSIAVDYGVSDTLTVGTNALISTVPWLAGAKGISLKARTLVYGTESLQSAATLYAGYLGASEFSSSWEVFTANTAWKPAPRHVVLGQLMFMNFGAELGKETSVDYTNIRFSTAAAGGGYQFLISDTLAVSSHALAALATSVEADTIAQSLSADLNATSGDALWGVVRISADLRTETDWLVSLGGIYFHGAGGQVLPWFSASTRW